MSEFVVHGILGSPFLRAVLATLEEKGAVYRLRAWKPGEHRTAAYRRLHPFSRVPVLQHGDFTLYETQAILRYLDAVCEGLALQPDEPRADARMNQIMGVNDWYFFPQVGIPVVMQRIVGPVLLGLDPDETTIAAAQTDAENCMRVLGGFLGAQTFMAGESLTLADMLLYPHMDYFGQTPEGRALIHGTPLQAWMERMAARPSMKATLPPEAMRKSV